MANALVKKQISAITNQRKEANSSRFIPHLVMTLSNDVTDKSKLRDLETKLVDLVDQLIELGCSEIVVKKLQPLSSEQVHLGS
jgi:hypothetical protein